MPWRAEETLWSFFPQPVWAVSSVEKWTREWVDWWSTSHFGKSSSNKCSNSPSVTCDTQQRSNSNQWESRRIYFHLPAKIRKDIHRRRASTWRILQRVCTKPIPILPDPWNRHGTAWVLLLVGHQLKCRLGRIYGGPKKKDTTRTNYLRHIRC